MILMRETTPATIRRGTVVTSASTPSTRKRTRISRPSGSRWMSDAPLLDRLGDDRVDELDDGRSSADSRRSTTSRVVLVLLVDGLGTASSRRLSR